MDLYRVSWIHDLLPICRAQWKLKCVLAQATVHIKMHLEFFILGYWGQNQEMTVSEMITYYWEFPRRGGGTRQCHRGEYWGEGSDVLGIVNLPLKHRESFASLGICWPWKQSLYCHQRLRWQNIRYRKKKTWLIGKSVSPSHICVH